MTAELLQRFWKSRYVHSPHSAFLRYFASIYPTQTVDFHYCLAVSEQGMKFTSEDHRAAWVASLLWHSKQTGAPVFWELPRDLEQRGNRLLNEFQREEQ
jgi:hypothetical protein